MRKKFSAHIIPAVLLLLSAFWGLPTTFAQNNADRQTVRALIFQAYKEGNDFIVPLDKNGNVTPKLPGSHFVKIRSGQSETFVYVPSSPFWHSLPNPDREKERFLNALSGLDEAARTALSQKGRADLASLTIPQRQEAVRYAKSMHRDEDKKVAAFYSQVIDKISTAPEAYLSLNIYPTIAVYRGNEAIGALHNLGPEKGYKFSTPKKQPPTPEKKDIEGEIVVRSPLPTELKPLLGESQIDIANQKIRIDEVFERLEGVTHSQFTLSWEITGLRLGISPGKWKVRQLVDGLCLAHGLEIKRVGEGFTVGPSPSVALASDLMNAEAIIEYQREQNIEKLRWFIESDYSRQGMKPFDPKRLFHSAEIPLNQLSDQEKSVIVAHLTPNTNLEQVRICLVFGFDWKLCDPHWKSTDLTLNLPEQEGTLISNGSEGVLEVWGPTFKSPLPPSRGLMNWQRERIEQAGGFLLMLENGVLAE